jgi:hypothetical protein
MLSKPLFSINVSRETFIATRKFTTKSADQTREEKRL